MWIQDELQKYLEKGGQRAQFWFDPFSIKLITWKGIQDKAVADEVFLLMCHLKLWKKYCNATNV